MFRDQSNRYATPFTTGLFIVSTVSGVALFFHVGAAFFHGMHEWLSMVLLVPVGLHVWKNWGQIANYLRRGWLIGPLAVSLVAALVFAAPSLIGGGGGGNPQTALAEALASARIADLGPVLKLSPQQIDARLAAIGITGASPEASLADVAASAGKDPRRVVFSVVSPR